MTGSGGRSARPVGIGVAPVGIAVALVASSFAAELVARGWVDDAVPANLLTLGVACIVFPIAVGSTVRCRRRAPGGALLVLAGAAAGAGTWRFSVHAWPATIGMAIFLATPLLALHVVLAHPEGVPTPAQRRALWAGHVGAAGIGLAALLTAADGLPGWIVAQRVDQPAVAARPALVVWGAPGLARGLYFVWWCAIVVAIAVGVVARWRRWRAAPAAARQVEGPVIAAATLVAASTAAAAFGVWLREAGTPGHGGSDVDVPASFADVSNFLVVVLPFLALAALAATIGWVELVRPRLSRTRHGVLDLGAEDAGGAGRLAERLADVLGDPTAAIVFPSGGGWVTAEGHRLALPTTDDGRAVTRLVRDGVPVAALVLDPADPPDTVALAVRLTAAAIDAERATAVALARAEEVRAATARLLRAGDTAARELGDRLRAGPIHDLEALAVRLRGDPACLDDAATALNGVAAQVRAVSHGVFPVELVDRGLRAVVPEHAAVPTRRLDRTVEITAYLAARDDPDARIEDRADALVITRRRPFGPEAVDRVLALGGDIVVDGEAIVATIPGTVSP